MISSLGMSFKPKKSVFVKKSIFVFFALFFINSFIYSQSPVAEVFSGRIQNAVNGSSFYFRILDVNEPDFNNYYAKSKEFILFNNYKSGYSADYKIGSLYYSSSKPFNLNDIHSLLKQLGFSQVKYDGALISVNDLPNKQIITPERNSNKQVRKN